MKILFVCLGNICRSPMAEGILKQLTSKHQLDWHIESAATESYHIGKPPDIRAIRTCKKYGIDISNQRARKLTHADFGTFDIVYALAVEVMVEINRYHATTAIQSELKLLLDEEFPGQHRSVPDPWYGDEAGFEPVFQLIRNACGVIIEKYGTDSGSLPTHRMTL
jgi:protein-tyrosine phosphatase